MLRKTLKISELIQSKIPQEIGINSISQWTKLFNKGDIPKDVVVQSKLLGMKQRRYDKEKVEKWINGEKEKIEKKESKRMSQKDVVQVISSIYGYNQEFVRQQLKQKKSINSKIYKEGRRYFFDGNKEILLGLVKQEEI